MAKKKSKKRQHSFTQEAKRQAEQEKLADEKSRAKKRMDPTARTLLLFDLVFMAVTMLLDPKGDGSGLISPEISGICTIIGIVLLLAALWFQFGPKGGGPKL